MLRVATYVVVIAEQINARDSTPSGMEAYVVGGALFT